MCDFCHKHGEGRKWYLEANNYAEDLLSDLRRRDMIKHFFRDPRRQKRGVDSLDRLDRAPGFVRRALTGSLVRRQKRSHYGQVVPIEDVERILGFVTSVTRVACFCPRRRWGRNKDIATA
jgi:hypothetical protein